jgi:hypothetical protein
MPVENYLLATLAVLAVVLLLATTGGIAYLTNAEWRDRRRRDREQRGK